MLLFAGQNCLHLASVQGFLSLVENLVDLGADIDAQVKEAHTCTLALPAHVSFGQAYQLCCVL